MILLSVISFSRPSIVFMIKRQQKYFILVLFKNTEARQKQDLLGQVSRLRKREELKLCKFILESCNLKVSL
jgi:hypothetical protein